jgi:hypothetical protein
MGVIYSRSGFTKPAIEKGRANQVSCCRLYDNEPVDIPSSIWIEQFACKPAVLVSLPKDSGYPDLEKWSDLFDIPDSQNQQTVLDIIAAAFSACEAKAMEIVNDLLKKGVGSFPKNLSLDVTFDLSGSKCKVTVGSYWKKYRARTEATLLQGSYCLTNSSFKGTMVGPSIDTWGESFGDAWEELKDSDVPTSSNFVLAIMSGSDVRIILREKLGDSPLNFGDFVS